MQTNDKYQMEFLVLNSNAWSHLTVCQLMSSKNSFKNQITHKQFAHTHTHTDAEDLTLNSPLGLICHKTTTNQHLLIVVFYERGQSTKHTSLKKNLSELNLVH